ncbi:MAG: carboxypeptidase-like regulatory domain-containing protein [Prolixibacteraceae bacterium]|nr:carboxypeptidase-like regulatory domain-containing protein [Prolixibacteraceae bacterium]
MRSIYTILLISLLLLNAAGVNAQSNNATLFGKLTDNSGKPLELVNISLKNTAIGTISNRTGEYLLRIPSKKPVTIVFSMIGYQTIEKVLNAGEEQRVELNVSLKQIDQEIGEVQITQHRREKGNMNRIDSKFLNRMTDAGTGGVEALIKTLPGVSTNNELSSQYSVRGGNFDENLVYVNDIEVYRPLLIRAGQQEGMSFINSDMVSSIEFSAGGFDAKYGDKMSSVLDIKYRKPTEFAGSASASLLGGSVQLEDLSKNGKFSHISGIRYKTNRYLLGTLDEKGEYDPRFVDFQTYVTYKFNKDFDLSFLANIAQNRYNFIPQTRETSFGTWNQAYNATIYFEGQEVDRFATQTGALVANYHPNDRLNLKFIASAYHSKEEETYDIKGDYYLNELERDLGSENLGDSVLNLGTGTFINHARNYLDATVAAVEHKGAYNSEKHLLNWGIKVQAEKIDDKMSEWILRDSTGYSIPYKGDKIELYSTTHTDYEMSSTRLSAFFQDTYQIPIGKGALYATAGVRAQYWSFNDQFIVSPRATLRYYPDWNANFVFHLSGGLYDQAPFYKELKDRKGIIYPETKAQRSAQVVLGSDYIFRAWDRPFKLSSELYFKTFLNLTPYQIDNVRIRYLPDQEAHGYATGLDMKVNGEFVSGIESWASLSVMKTEEDVLNDNHGYIPRPTDQRFNFSIFFQDYFPGNPTWKMHLTAFYGSRLPTGPPMSERYQDIFRIPPYRRIDLGFSKVLINQDHKKYKNKAFDHIKDMWLSLEVFNLLGINNTISYFWVANNSGDMFAVPNYLTQRKLNLKLTVKF